MFLIAIHRIEMFSLVPIDRGLYDWVNDHGPLTEKNAFWTIGHECGNLVICSAT